jgi:hypothetical protein
VGGTHHTAHTAAATAHATMTHDEERWLNDRNVVRDPESRNLFYKSKALNRDVYLAELLTLHPDDLTHLLAEVDAVIAELRSVTGSFNDAVDSLPPATAKSLRFKNFINLLFRQCLIAEKKHRKQVKAEEDSQKHLEKLRLKAEVERHREEKRQRKAQEHARHQKKLGKFEYHKRRIFYELLADRVGRSFIDELMTEAGKTAAAQMDREEPES